MTARPRPDLDRAILGTMTTAIAVFDRDMRLDYLNPAAEELLKRSLGQGLGTPAAALFEDAPRFVDALARVFESGRPLVERELPLSMPESGAMLADCALTPLTGDGAGVLAEFVPQDRHQQIRREERLVAETESARAVLRGLAHEIRNPLGGLRGAAQLLERELEAPELAEYTQVIVGEADRLQSLLDRMVGPRNPPRLAPINIHEVTERVYSLVRAETPDGVEVHKDYDPSIPPIVADAELLIQAVLNVARNAVQALGQEGRLFIRTRIHRQFTIGASRHRLVARIDVGDNGPGVPDALADRIFHPMVTGRVDGTGLGLSIAQSLVQQHGGLIECTSQPGNTVFSVLLPIDAEAPAREARR